MTTTNSPIDERQLYAYMADHSEIANGQKFHRATLRSLKYNDELLIPFVAKAFAPGHLLRRLQERMAGSVDARAVKGEPDPAQWLVNQLLDIAEREDAPATARLAAVERIRQLMAVFFVAFHPPAAEALNVNAPDEVGEKKSHVAEFLARKRAAS